jgi:hypothetical protein
MPEYIQLNQSSNLALSSGADKFALQINNNNTLLLVDNNGVSSSVNVITTTYPIYVALLTQSGSESIDDIYYDDYEPLTIGVTYTITSNDAGADFTNIGASNNNVDTIFVATGTSPANWGEGAVSYNTGAPVVKVIKNTLGFNPAWIRDGAGVYGFNFPTTPDFNKISSQISRNIQNVFVYVAINNTFDFTIYTTNNGNTSTDTLLNNTPIEIKIYP